MRFSLSSLLAILITPWLAAQIEMTDKALESDARFNILLIQMRAFAVWLNAMYPDSAVDAATTHCFLDFYNIVLTKTEVIIFKHREKVKEK